VCRQGIGWQNREVVPEVKPGAFILFGRNIESAPQLRKLIDDLRDLSEIEPSLR
jgi:beta-glucosidase-like glycosyl hydrolase